MAILLGILAAGLLGAVACIALYRAGAMVDEEEL